MIVFKVKWTPLDMTHWQTRIAKSYQDVLKVYPPGCLDWLRESEPGRMVELKATVEKIKRAYTERDSQGLDAALTSYRDTHLKTFEDYLLEVKTAA